MSKNIKDIVCLFESIEENYSSHLREYIDALEQVLAGSLINLTTISVILSRLDFLKKINTKHFAGNITLSYLINLIV